MWLVKGQLGTMAPAGIVNSGEPAFLLTAPAYEPAYDFRITMYCLWQPSRRRWSSRLPADREELAQVYEIIRKTVRLIGRKFSIFHPAQAELAINERLAQELASNQRSGWPLSPGWTARAEVGLPDEVLDLMRKTLDKEYGIRAKAQADRLLMSETGDLRAGWDQFLNDAAESANAQHAVRLAEDPSNVAQALEEVLKNRRKGTEDLLKLIDRIVEAQRSADILDLVVKSETVLRQTLKMVGIPLTETETGTFLESLDQET